MGQTPKVRMERTEHSLITNGVQEHEQTLQLAKPFWVFFVGNMGVSSWLMGVLIAGMGLNFTQGMFALVLGGIIGSALPAATAILGPMTRLSQMEAGRFALGEKGKKLPAFLNWVGAIGWDVISNILSTAALITLLAIYNLSTPFWLALAILVGAQLVIGIYGHHLIQDTSKYTGLLLGVLFTIIWLIAMNKYSGSNISTGAAPTKDVFSALVLLVAYNVGSWPLYSADYTRYLPRNTSSAALFLRIFLALFISAFLVPFFGFITASSITEQTPEGVMKGLQALTGSFSPLVLFLVAFSAIPTNAINDNSAAYSLMSAGIKVTRPAAAIFGAVLGYFVCLFASDSFVDFFENFLSLFFHWVTPWSAIILVHWFFIRKTERRTPSGITIGCYILLVVSMASIGLFSANSLYTGLLSNAIGGVDVGPYVGFIVAGLSYYAAFRLWPNKFKVMRIQK